MKILLLLFQVAISEAASDQPHTHVRQVNSIKSLPRTVQTLVTAVQSNSFEVPSSFLRSKKENQAARWNKITNDSFRSTKQKIGTAKDMIAWDTIRYMHNNTRMMDLSLIFNTINPKNQSADTSRVVMMFNVNGDKLTMTNCRNMSDKEYDQHIIKEIDNERRDEVYRKYSRYLFNDPTTKSIPYQDQGQWGLMSLDGHVVVPAQYDSISKPEFGYRHIISKKGHNLLDKDLKPVFDKPRKNIRVTTNSYEVLNDKGTYEIFGVTTPAASNAIGVQRLKSKDATKEIGDRYIAAITSDSLQTFNAGKYVTHDGYVVIYDKKTRLFGAYCLNTNVLIQPIYRCVVPVARGRYYIVLNKTGMLGYLNSNGKELF